VSLITPESVWELQQALHVKAKREPACRFHSLYDKLYRKDVLLYNHWTVSPAGNAVRNRTATIVADFPPVQMAGLTVGSNRH